MASEEKIDLIDKSLTRLTRLVEKLNADSSTPPRSTDLTTPSHATSRSGPPVPVIEQETRLPNNGAVVRSNDIAENEVLVEGQSSLTAHSEFAIGFLHNAVGSHEIVGDGSEITGLLGTLRHIVDAFNHHRLSPKLLLPLAQPVSCGDRGSCPIAPLEAVFAVIHKAQGILSRPFPFGAGRNGSSLTPWMSYGFDSPEPGSPITKWIPV